jgi:hypothetical protein
VVLVAVFADKLFELLGWVILSNSWWSKLHGAKPWLFQQGSSSC